MTVADRLARPPSPQPHAPIGVGSSRALEPARTRPQRDWSELLRDLTAFEQARIETTVRGASLRQSAHLQGIRVQNGFGLAVGRRFRLHFLLERWHRLRPLAPRPSGTPNGIRIEDIEHRALLDLGLEDDAERMILAELLDRHRSEPARILRHPGGLGLGPLPTADSAKLGCTVCERRSDCSSQEMADIARICDWPSGAATSPAPDRTTRAIAPESALALLRMVVERTLPVRLLLGTQGVAQRFEGVFHHIETRHDGRMMLAGDQVEFELTPTLIGSTSIVELTTRTHPHRQLWLRRRCGRTLAMIEDAPGFCETENPIWGTFINALLD